MLTASDKGAYVAQQILRTADRGVQRFKIDILQIIQNHEEYALGGINDK